MAVTGHVYTKYGTALLAKQVNVTTDGLWVMLMNGYTPNKDTEQFVADALLDGTEAVGSGYTTGGQALTSVAVVQVASILTVSAADAVWTPSTLTATHAVFYDALGGSSATNRLVSYWDFGGPENSSATAFHLGISVVGVFTLMGS